VPGFTGPPLRRGGTLPAVRAADELYRLMSDLSTGWFRWLRNTATAGERDSLTRWRVLRILFTADEAVTMRRLAGELGVAPRTVTDLIDVMARDGLVVRQPHPRDRRSTVLSLTEAGQHRYLAVTYSHLKSTAAAFSVLTPTELAEFTRLARLVLAAMNDAGAPGDRGTRAAASDR